MTAKVYNNPVKSTSRACKMYVKSFAAYWAAGPVLAHSASLRANGERSRTIGVFLAGTLVCPGVAHFARLPASLSSKFNSGEPCPLGLQTSSLVNTPSHPLLEYVLIKRLVVLVRRRIRNFSAFSLSCCVFKDLRRAKAYCF